MTTMTSTAELITLTETLFAVPFETDMEATEVSIDTPQSDATVAFAPLRVAPAIPAPDTAADQVEALWVQYGYTVTRSREEQSGTLIIDAHTPRGDTLTCQIGPAATLLTGESAPA